MDRRSWLHCGGNSVGAAEAVDNGIFPRIEKKYMSDYFEWP